MENLSLQTEEDVRTKLAYEFLKNSGVPVEQLSFERTISIRLGTKVKPMTGRIDLLVKNSEGKNLIIFEIKKPSHKIIDEDIDQAISYAKLVCGNIAPYTVLMNGQDEARLFCSYTYDEISAKDINFKIAYKPPKTVEKLQQEALRILVDNETEGLFSSFFADFLEANLKPLVGGINSNKKYCPELYIELSENLTKLNDFSIKDIFLVTAPPQFGKTNFLIHNAKNLSLSANVIFLSAYKLTKSLKDTIQEAFNNHYGFNFISHFEIIRNSSESQKYYLFIDGLNEVGYEKRLEILHDLESYNQAGLKIVVSCTDTFLATLQKDTSDNPTIIGDYEFTNKRKTINLLKPNEGSTTDLYKRYSKAYGVSLSSSHIKVNNPYLLRLAMELYQNQKMPDHIETNEVIKQSIHRRSDIIDNILQINCRMLLNDLALAQLNSKFKISESYFCSLLGKHEFSRCPDEFLTYGLLTKDSQKGCTIEFYYDSIRDYFISESLFNQNHLKGALIQSQHANNRDIARSVVYSYFKRNNLPYASIINLDYSVIIGSYEALGTVFLEQAEKKEEEVKHFLVTLINIQKDTSIKSPIFDTFVERIFDNYEDLDFNLNDFTKEITILIGMYTMDNKFGPSSSLFSGEFLYDFEPSCTLKSDLIYLHLTEIILRFNNNEISNEDLIPDIISLLQDVNESICEDDLRIISSLVNDMVDEYYNGVSLFCGGPSYLSHLKEDYSNLEWDEHVYNLNELASLLIQDNLQAVHEVRNELSSLSNNHY